MRPAGTSERMAPGLYSAMSGGEDDAIDSLMDLT
jgi:hypothetical protein